MLHRPRNRLSNNHGFFFSLHTFEGHHIHLLDICHWIQFPLVNYNPSIFSWEVKESFTESIPYRQTFFVYIYSYNWCIFNFITSCYHLFKMLLRLSHNQAATQITKVLCDNTNKGCEGEYPKCWPIRLTSACAHRQRNSQHVNQLKQRMNSPVSNSL